MENLSIGLFSSILFSLLLVAVGGVEGEEACLPGLRGSDGPSCSTDSVLERSSLPLALFELATLFCGELYRFSFCEVVSSSGGGAEKRVATEVFS